MSSVKVKEDKWKGWKEKPGRKAGGRGKRGWVERTPTGTGGI